MRFRIPPAFVCIAGIATAASFAASAKAGPGEFTLSGELVTPRSSPTATLLQDGRVLIAGGNKPSDPGLRAAAADAEIYDPATDTFAATGDMTVLRYDHAAAALPDGRVLLVGGSSGSNDDGVSFTQANGEVYDPQTGTFTAIESEIEVGGERTSATALLDGRILVVGGWIWSQGTVDRAQLFDPDTNTFSETGNLHTGRIVHTATRLADGRVLVAGGLSSTDGLLDSAEIYDPASGTFELLDSSMTASRERHAAALLPDGRVLIAGGYSTGGNQLDSAELFDPVTGTFTASNATMMLPRVDFPMVPLDNGSILAIGSYQWGLNAGTAELYDATVDSFVSIDPGPATERFGTTATKLADGRVLVAGGNDQILGGNVPYGELYTPAVVDRLFADGFETAAD